MVARSEARYGRIDILVNNAHYLDRIDIPFAELSADDLRRQLDSGVTAVFHTMQACYEPFRRGGGGKIVNMGSVAGVLGMANFGAYAATKEAIRAMTRVVAREWGRDGINANCICPSVPTPATDAWNSRVGRVEDHTTRPIPRAGRAEEDIGRTVVFLAGPDSDFITGYTFMLDGGVHMDAGR
jgi:NAD(P)-dependent dehydrogenase (short-subunit alcohol dehydrogenase family)